MSAPRVAIHTAMVIGIAASMLLSASPAVAQHAGARGGPGGTEPTPIATTEAARATQVRSPVTAARPRMLGLRAYAFSDSTEMRAAETFQATLDATRMQGLGAGFEVLRLWEGIFARLNYSTSSRAGERVAMFDDEAIPLGIPMRVELNPLEAGLGWRSDVGPREMIGIYGGGGLLRMRYRQTSDFAQNAEDFDETFNGYMAFGGVDVTIGGWVMIGAEGQYRRVPDALGQSGVSEAFGETDLGGTTFRVLVGIRR